MPLKEARYREKILLYLARNLSNNVTANRIANDLDLFYSLVHKTVKDLENEGLLKIEKVGNYKLLKLSLNKHRTLLELALLSHKLMEEQEKEGKIDGSVNGLVKKIAREKDVLSAVLCKDNLLIISNKATMHLEIASKTASIGKEICLISHEEAVKKLSDAQFSDNLLNGIILHGYENFWKMIAESRELV